MENHSWLEQAKPIENNKGESFHSLWEAAQTISKEKGCLHSTAKKEIRRAIVTGKPRYGRVWFWKDK